MSPTVNNFVHDLVAMAKAMEDLPIVQEKLDRANSLISRYAEDVQHREESIIRLKAELEASHEARRKVEAERDDAETRFLEGEDRTRSALDFIKSTFGSAGSLIQALEPPAPTPVAVPADAPATLSDQEGSSATAEEKQIFHDYIADAPSTGQSASDPTDASASTANTPTGEANSGASTVEASSDPGPAIGTDFHLRGDPTNVDSVSSGPGSEVSPAPADPTASSVAGDGHSLSTATPSPTAETVADASTQVSPSPTPPSDDVGYHNEPIPTDGQNGWQAWDAWATKMNDRFGPGSWPARSTHPNVI